MTVLGDERHRTRGEFGRHGGLQPGIAGRLPGQRGVAVDVDDVLLQPRRGNDHRQPGRGGQPQHHRQGESHASNLILQKATVRFPAGRRLGQGAVRSRR